MSVLTQSLKISGKLYIKLSIQHKKEIQKRNCKIQQHIYTKTRLCLLKTSQINYKWQ